ncbi:ComEC/Rec2 family competence protein [Photobacterium kishitanii]|uniref:Metallo-beta-lactamase domain-containing protein n=1 Tax=Photobacterium kishitanii TaxID=318456 RepID=A0A2T3KDZ4_9GAMM|nr:MBL fold metallo-hydrolase [Photobacterium kishitanii]PSU95075.1 hypothetical protein C9J27_18940 [Photobacterium kishitanii]
MVKIKMYPAREGDAFLIKLGRKNIVIDMGLNETYEKYIKQDISSIKELGESIDLLIVTHVDNDHIMGVISLLEDNETSENPIEIKEIWHNSYRHLGFDKISGELPNTEKKILTKLVRSNQNPKLGNGISEVKIDEGITLASLLYRNKLNWNTSISNYIVSNESDDVRLDEDTKIKIISPNSKKIAILREKWKDVLESEKYNFKITDDKLFDDAYEMYMKSKNNNFEIKGISNETDIDFDELVKKKNKDKSPTNGSSIALIIESKNKRLLFLGDSHEDNIYEELDILKKNGESLDFDVVKLSHHGSNANVSERFLNLISAKIFLISTNGRYAHPSLSTIAKVIKCHPKSQIITNYKHNKVEAIASEYDFNVSVSNIIEVE